MSIPFLQKSRIILFICCVTVSVAAVGIFLTVETNGQRRSVETATDNDLITKVEGASGVQLRILENSDTPLNLLSAVSKEVSAAEFTSLTGAATQLTNVTSFPEATLKNNSTKTISSFMLVVRDPADHSMRSQMFRNTAIAPGGQFTVTASRFITPEKFTRTDGKGAVTTGEKSRLQSVSNWIQFGERANLFVTVGMVTFDDGSQWTLKEEGEIK